MLDKTIKTRWLSAASYDEKWVARSEELLSMFFQYEDKAKQWTFSEYGCGPYAPFKRLASDREGYQVNTYDLKSWDHNNEVVDLNSTPLDVRTSDVGVLSGVCEYLNDLETVLKSLSQFHQYFLISYASVPLSMEFHDAKYIKEIRMRSVNRGWRNHLNIKEFIGLVSTIGYVAHIGTWDRQTLLYVRGFSTNL